jgi:hypothetical protein
MAQSLSSKLNLTVTASGFSSGLGEVSNTQFFTGPGTWTKPPDASSVEVWVVGAGGGGGGGNSGQPSTSYAQRGADGGVGMKIIQNVTTPQPVTVGSGGSGGGLSADGSDGGESKFGPGPIGWAKATGGTGGVGRSTPAGIPNATQTDTTFGSTANCQIDLGAMVRPANGNFGTYETWGDYEGRPNTQHNRQHLGWMSYIDVRERHYPSYGSSSPGGVGGGTGQGGAGGTVTGGPTNPNTPGQPGTPGGVLVISYKD